jgi:hypothetical protein
MLPEIIKYTFEVQAEQSSSFPTPLRGGGGVEGSKETWSSLNMSARI